MFKKKIVIFFNQFFFFFLSKIKRRNYKKDKLLISKIKNKKVYLLNFSSIGSNIISTCYLNRLITEKKVDIQNLIIISNKISLNSFWQGKMKKKFNIRQCPNIFNYLTKHSKDFKSNIIEWPFDGTNFEYENSLGFRFNENEKLHGESILKKLNVDLKKKIATISYKSNQYWLDREGNKKKFENYRLSKPENLFKSVEFLKLNNYQVIFTGQPSDKDKKILHNCLFYDHLDQKEKDFFDFYIYYKSDFSIIGHSGDLAFAYLFNKPVLHHNAINPNFFCKGIILPKYFYSTSTNQILDIKKFTSIKKYHFFSDIIFPRMKKISAIHFKNSFYFESKNISLIENSDEDILEAVKELKDYVCNNFKQKLHPSDLKLQADIKNIIYSQSISKDTTILKLKKFNGYISPHYLKKINNLKNLKKNIIIDMNTSRSFASACKFVELINAYKNDNCLIEIVEKDWSLFKDKNILWDPTKHPNDFFENLIYPSFKNKIYISEKKINTLDRIVYSLKRNYITYFNCLYFISDRSEKKLITKQIISEYLNKLKILKLFFTLYEFYISSLWKINPKKFSGFNFDISDHLKTAQVTNFIKKYQNKNFVNILISASWDEKLIFENDHTRNIGGPILKKSHFKEFGKMKELINYLDNNYVKGCKTRFILASKKAVDWSEFIKSDKIDLRNFEKLGFSLSQMIYICANITNFSINWPSTFSIWITNEKKINHITFYSNKDTAKFTKKRIDDKIEGYKEKF